jgi:type II secretory pathway component PulF
MTGFILTFLAGLIWSALLILMPCGAYSVLLDYLSSKPAHRRDRALFFLDLIETALDRGQSPEKAILSAAEARDSAIGTRFYILAAHIEGGLRLGEALEKERSFLPAQVNAMIRAGEKLGDLRKILPACREVLRVSPETVRFSASYFMTVLMMFGIVGAGIIFQLSLFVFPRFQEVAAGFSAHPGPVAQFVYAHSGILVIYEIIIFLILQMVVLSFGNNLASVSPRRFPFGDWLAWQIPWQQKKLLRSFSSMLAVLLDGGVPEAEAVRLAGESTANEICRRRGCRIVAELEQGATLNEAVRIFDRTGEFHWRLTNATHAKNGFLAALHGWHEALDTKAFQEEETAAHSALCGLVVINGVVVALVAIAIFGFLVAILKGALDTL